MSRSPYHTGGGPGGSSIANTVTLVSATEPTIMGDGNMYYNTTDNTLYVAVSGAWVAISGGAPAGGTFDFIDGTGFDFIDGTYFDFIV